MGRVYRTEDKLTRRDQHNKKCTYMRLEFTEAICALLFGRFDKSKHSCRNELLLECDDRLFLQKSSFIVLAFH